jgi:hypothetical protein
MKTLINEVQNWKDISILTIKNLSDGTREITGYSSQNLEHDDEIIFANRKFKVIEEKERRDARGKWKNGEEKNRWFKAVVL